MLFWRIMTGKFAIADSMWGGILFVIARHLLKAF